VAIVASFAIGGALMMPLPPTIVVILLITTLALDFVKIGVLSHLRID